ncbi:MAG: hypothetical protein HQ517_16085 [SAR324 cluster bacterium]|nr:hypothetical protein [SAR324 cluster bacterium]
MNNPDMKQSTRIKAYLKKQIENGNITKKDILKLQAKDLSDVKELKDIGTKTKSQTIESVKQLLL